MRLIAFDPSYRTTGFAVVESGGNLITHGIIRTSGDDDCSKFSSLFDDVQTLCTKYHVERGMVEKPPSFSYRRSTNSDGKPLNFAAIQKNSQATAVILSALGQMRIKVVESHAHQWKLCYGKNLGKRDMIALAKRSFPGLKDKKISDHEAEAICMALLNS
ncbi:MAG: crossover junction endodeoxyribonuclease RuvC [Nitrospira sp.]|nr:crossover junction endodeoxyribonuclease RuvC [Nitrospira sp.]